MTESKKGYVMAVSTVVIALVLITLVTTVARELALAQDDATLRESIRIAPYVFDDVAEDYKVIFPFNITTTQNASNITIRINDNIPVTTASDTALFAYRSFLANHSANTISANVSVANESAYTQNTVLFTNGMSYQRVTSTVTDWDEVWLAFGSAAGTEKVEMITIYVNASSNQAPTPIPSDAGGNLTIILNYTDNKRTLYQNINVSNNGTVRNLHVDYQGSGNPSADIWFVASSAGVPSMGVHATDALPVRSDMAVILNTTEQPMYYMDGLAMSFVKANITKRGTVYIGG